MHLTGDLTGQYVAPVTVAEEIKLRSPPVQGAGRIACGRGGSLPEIRPVPEIPIELPSRNSKFLSIDFLRSQGENETLSKCREIQTSQLFIKRRESNED
jgi:hypothetical protein